MKAAELLVDGLVEHRVEGLDVGPGRRARQELRGAKLGRTPGDPVQGPSPGRFDYWHLSGRPAGCCSAVVARSSGLRAPVGQLGPEPGLSAEAEWPGQGDCHGRIVRVRGSRQREELGGSLSWQLVPRGLCWMVACRSAESESGQSVSEVCWNGAGSAQAGPRAREGPGCAGRRGPGRGPLNPTWVGVGRHDQRSWRGLKKIGYVEMSELTEVCLDGEVPQTCPPEIAKWLQLILWPLVENS